MPDYVKALCEETPDDTDRLRSELEGSLNSIPELYERHGGHQVRVTESNLDALTLLEKVKHAAVSGTVMVIELDGGDRIFLSGTSSKFRLAMRQKLGPQLERADIIYWPEVSF